ncbi:MAG: hypothetical protein ACKOI2_01210 [Actinomycetota bacterium]
MKKVQVALVMSGTLLGLASGGPVIAAAENLPWSDGGAGASKFQVQVDSACIGNGIGFRDDDSYGFDQGSVLAVGTTIIGSAATSVHVTTSGSDSIGNYSETVGDFLWR